jgi:hypothetical protein
MTPAITFIPLRDKPDLGAILPYILSFRFSENPIFIPVGTSFYLLASMVKSS